MFESLVDPLVLRAADVLLAGATGVETHDRARWRALTSNWTAVLTFFDLLVFQEEIPMIDYGLTFMPPSGFEVAVLYDLVNSVHADIGARTPQPLVTVHVSDSAAAEARAHAIAALVEHGPVEATLRDSIAVELSDFDHAWRPPLKEVDERFDGDFASVDRDVTTFVYGGLLFGEFAAQAHTAHCLHSKRARLDLAVALDAPSASFDAEGELRQQLDAMLAQALGAQDLWMTGLSSLPPVLPYLLTRYQPESLNALLLHALEFRQTDLAATFRHWKRRAVESIEREMLPPPEVEREMREVADGIRRHLEPASKGFEMTFRYVPVPTAWRDRLWSWALRSMPGRRHVKLLFDLQIADRRYSYAGRLRALQHTLGQLWKEQRP